MNLFHYFNNSLFEVDNLGLGYLVNGKENSAFTLIISVIAKISEMVRTTLRERQLEGIQMAEIKGKYKELEKDYPNPRRDF